MEGRCRHTGGAVGDTWAAPKTTTGSHDPPGGPPPATVAVTDREGLPIGQAVQIFQNGDFNAPFPPDGGAGGNADTCVVVKLFGVSSSGGVVTIDVTKGDILRDHPARD